MYYEVVSKKAVTYTDESGKERRANPGSIINVKVRSEAKRLKKAKSIKPIDLTAPTGNDFTLREILTDPPVADDSEGEGEGKDKEEEEGVLKLEALVRIIGTDDVGEVKHLTPKFVKISFDENQEPVRVSREKVEVVG